MEPDGPKVMAFDSLEPVSARVTMPGFSAKSLSLVPRDESSAAIPSTEVFPAMSQLPFADHASVVTESLNRFA